MLKAFSLIEMMTTIAVLSIAVYFISPTVFLLNDRVALQNEIELIQSFIYRVQSKARFEKQSYSLSISQQNNQWCIIAVQKEKGNTKEIPCDCLNINSCQIKQNYLLYQPQLQGSYVNSSKLFPRAFMNIDGLAGRLESQCLGISRNNAHQVLQFYQYGIVNVLAENRRSQCRILDTE